MFSLCMSVWKMRIKMLWRSSKCASPFFACFKKRIATYEGHDKLQPLLYARLNTVNHGFTKALKMCISFLWVFQKCASRFLQAIKKRISVACALQQCATRFYEGVKNAHRLFISLSKICTTIYGGHKKVHLLCKSAFNNVHHGFTKALKRRISFLWVSQKRASRFMKVWAICISFDERLKFPHTLRHALSTHSTRVTKNFSNGPRPY